MLDEVRAGCAFVAERARSVRIDARALAAYALSFTPDDLVDPIDATPPVADERTATGSWALEQRVGRVLALDAINFGSGYHPHVRKRPGCSGAVTMATALREWMAERTLAAAALASMTAHDCHTIFDQPTGDEACRELMGHFAAALRDLGTLVADRYGGAFCALVADADGSADRLVAVLAQMPTFRDVSVYDGRSVPLYKRAQITAADLARELHGRGPGAFDDLDDLTAFADNLVPHVLRVDGVLSYDDGLARRIDAGVEIRAGSPEEVEIRAVGVHAVEQLRAALADTGTFVRSSRLDEVLWLRGGGARYKAIPRHRTRSVFY